MHVRKEPWNSSEVRGNIQLCASSMQTRRVQGRADVTGCGRRRGGGRKPVHAPGTVPSAMEMATRKRAQL